MNITTDNYEVYLIDYLDGNLNAEETERLKAFVTAQGLDWDELTEDLPYLEAPQIVYQNKSELRSLSLSKGRPERTIPLYVKIASAAAAAGLLLTIGLWLDKQLPKVEPIAELKPIEATLTVNEAPIRIIPRKAVPFTECQHTKTEVEKTPERIAVEVVTTLSPMKPQETLALKDAVPPMEPDLNLLRCRLEAEQAFAYLLEETAFEEELPTSWIGRGIYRMSEGRHRSIGDLINAGLHIAKKEVIKGVTEVALTTYSRAEEHFEESKEHWQEKHGE